MGGEPKGRVLHPHLQAHRGMVSSDPVSAAGASGAHGPLMDGESHG
jgi:hypothetical protein